MEYAKDGANSPDLEFQLALTDFGEGKYKEAEARFRVAAREVPHRNAARVRSGRSDVADGPNERGSCSSSGLRKQRTPITGRCR